MFKYAKKFVPLVLVFVIIFSGANPALAKEDVNAKSNFVNQQLQVQEINKQMVDEGWVTTDKDGNIYFTDKYVDAIKTKNINSTIYREKNSIRIIDNLGGGQNAFVFNSREQRYELFMSQERTQNIINAASDVSTVVGILSGIIPAFAAICTIAAGLINLGASALQIKNKSHGTVILISKIFIPYWVCTQA